MKKGLKNLFVIGALALGSTASSDLIKVGTERADSSMGGSNVAISHEQGADEGWDTLDIYASNRPNNPYNQWINLFTDPYKTVHNVDGYELWKDVRPENSTTSFDVYATLVDSTGSGSSAQDNGFYVEMLSDWDESRPDYSITAFQGDGLGGFAEVGSCSLKDRIENNGGVLPWTYDMNGAVDGESLYKLNFTAVPEPATMTLLGLGGLAALGIGRMRRNRF